MIVSVVVNDMGFRYHLGAYDPPTVRVKYGPYEDWLRGYTPGEIRAQIAAMWQIPAAAEPYTENRVQISDDHPLVDGQHIYFATYKR